MKSTKERVEQGAIKCSQLGQWGRCKYVSQSGFSLHMGFLLPSKSDLTRTNTV